MKKYLAEMIGTMVLVLMGCGSAVFAGAIQAGGSVQPFAAVGTLGVAFAFGLSVVAMAYTIGKISGCHINPAITLGMLISKKISGKDAGMYMVFQFIGALIGSAVLYILAKDSGSVTTLTGANGLVGNTTVMTALLAEIIFTFVFLMVVFGSTSKGSANGFAGLAIGLALVLVHIVCIPITGTSVNPARSFGPAVFELINGNGVALSQLWIFIVGPFIGAIIAAFVWKAIDTEE